MAIKLVVDFSDSGAGSVLLQEDSNGVAHSVHSFPKKLLTNIKLIILQLRKNVCLSFLLFSILKFISSLHPHLLWFSVITIH